MSYPHTPSASDRFFSLRPPRPSRALLGFVALLAPLGDALPAQAACPPAVTGLTATSSICGGNILLTFDPPATGLNFPQIFSAPFGDFFFAQLIATGNLNSTSFDAPPFTSEVPTFYWVRWQGLDSACPTGPLAGPVSAVSVIPGIAAAGVSQSLTAPALSVGCTSITLSWQRFREPLTATIVRTPLSGPGANVAQTLGTVLGTVTTFTDSTGSPGVQYDYKVLYTTAACGLTNAPSRPARVVFPPSTGVPVIAPADVLAGSPATLSVVFPAQSPGFGPAPQWFRGSTLITDIPGRISGAGTTALTFTPALSQDQGIYTLRTATPCGPLTPIPVSLIVRATCPADFNADAHVGVDDIFAFLSAWFAGCP
jgi:hypothetical protein